MKEKLIIDYLMQGLTPLEIESMLKIPETEITDLIENLKKTPMKYQKIKDKMEDTLHYHYKEVFERLELLEKNNLLIISKENELIKQYRIYKEMKNAIINQTNNNKNLWNQILSRTLYPDVLDAYVSKKEQIDWTISYLAQEASEYDHLLARTIQENLEFWVQLFITFHLSIKEWNQLFSFSQKEFAGMVLMVEKEKAKENYQQALAYYLQEDTKEIEKEKLREIKNFLKSGKVTELYQKMKESDIEAETILKRKATTYTKNDWFILVKYRMKYVLPLKSQKYPISFINYYKHVPKELLKENHKMDEYLEKDNLKKDKGVNYDKSEFKR